MAGNPTTATATYRVQYLWQDFSQPIAPGVRDDELVQGTQLSPIGPAAAEGICRQADAVTAGTSAARTGGPTG